MAKSDSTPRLPDVRPLRIVAAALSTTFRRLWMLFPLLALLIAAAMAAELAPPLLLRRVLDSYLAAGQAEGLSRLAITYVGALILASTVGFLLAMITTVIGQNILLDLRLLMAAHLPRLPMRYYNTTAVGETMSRLTADVESVNTLFSAGLVHGLVDLLKVVGVVGAMLTISPLLTAIALAVAPLIYVLADYFRRHIYGAQLETRRSVGAVNAFLQETFSGMRTLKAYGQEERIRKGFEGPLLSNLRAVNQAAVYESYFPCVMQILRAATIAVVVWVGARTGAAGALGVTIGGLAAMVDLIGRLFAPVEALSQEYQTIQQAMAGLRRIAELLEEPAEERGELDRPPSRTRGVGVAVEGLWFGYDPDRPVLRGMSLEVAPGRRVAIVGRTGAGKTTLMNLIAGLYRADRGSVRVGGHDPHRLDPAARRRLVGVVPQTVHLFEGTVQENITLRDDAIPLEDVVRAAKTVDLHDLIMGLPDGYQTRLGEADGKLSYGQMQLLALARAIVADPPLLLLDEPTSGLDAVTERAVFDAFRAAGAHRTILTISHRLSGVLDADEVHIVAQGRIVQSGAPDALAGEEGWYRVFKQLEDLGWSAAT